MARNRQNATHSLKATRQGEIPCSADGQCPPTATCGPNGVCIDAYGNPVSGDYEAVTEAPVRFDSGGPSFVRDNTGARVHQSPTVTGAGDLADNIEEGDGVTLTPYDSDASPIGNLEVRSVETHYGRYVRNARTVIELAEV